MKYYTMDMEWQLETGKYHCAVLYSPKFHFTDMTCSSYFSDMILEKLTEKENIIYAHYGGGSDFLFLLRELVGYPGVYFNEKRFYQANGKIISFTIYYRNREYQFRDSYAILFDSLNKLSESFLNKVKIYDSSKLETPEQELEQCFNDAKLLWEVIEAFMNELGIDNLPLTYSSLAFQDLQKRCDFSKLKEQTKDEYEMFLPWFAGGHVDVYRRFSTPCFAYDIKSSYPSVQYEFGCPIGHFKETKSYNENCAGLYLITTNCKVWNPFLWRKNDNKRIYFVNGSDFFCVTDIELRKLEELNFSYKIFTGFEWEIDQDFFKDFVSHWFQYKEQGGARRLIGKYMLCGGGYGKFAIGRNRDIITFGNDADYVISADYNIGIKKQWVDFSYSQIHIAARITAGGRIKLFEAQQKNASDILCYSDTDSVSVSRNISGISNNKNLGELSFEEKFKRSYFLGNKFYCGVRDDNSCKVILKGFPEKFSEDHFKNALKGNINFRYAKKRLMKMRSALRTSHDFVHVQEFLREVKTIEIKRKLNSDGITTEPYYLKQGELL